MGFQLLSLTQVLLTCPVARTLSLHTVQRKRVSLHVLKAAFPNTEAAHLTVLLALIDQVN